MVAEATRLTTGASGVAPNGGVRLPSEFSIMADAFAPGQVLNFGSQAYIVDCYGELRSLDRAALVSGELPTPPPPLGLLGADLEVLAQQIQRSLGPSPTVSDSRQMFYMLANVHH